MNLNIMGGGVWATVGETYDWMKRSFFSKKGTLDMHSPLYPADKCSLFRALPRLETRLKECFASLAERSGVYGDGPGTDAGESL